MAKEVKYESVAERFVTERSTGEILTILIALLEAMYPGFFEDGVNKLFPRADGEPHTASYTKPQ